MGLQGWVFALVSGQRAGVLAAGGVMAEFWRQCANGVGNAGGGATAFWTVGPLRGGGWLESVTVLATTSATDSITLGMVLSASAEATLANFQAGTSLIQRSTVALAGGPPLWTIAITASGVTPIRLPMHVRLGTGSQYIICRTARGLAGNSWIMIVAEAVGGGAAGRV